jgi:metal-dependent amidase/aminoacylase/carboxypeptidase family protein
LKYPGAFYWLGTSVGEGQKPLHDPEFRLNEDGLSIGVAVMMKTAVDTLANLNQRGGE